MADRPLSDAPILTRREVGRLGEKPRGDIRTAPRARTKSSRRRSGSAVGEAVRATKPAFDGSANIWPEGDLGPEKETRNEGIRPVRRWLGKRLARGAVARR